MATPMLAGLLKVAATDPKLKGLVANVGQDLHITGIDQARPWALGTLAHHAPVLAVTATSREAEDLTAELTAMMGDKVAMFPSWETLPHERLSPGVDIIGKRAQVALRSFIQVGPPPGLLDFHQVIEFLGQIRKIAGIA